jgi:hypothetical protein
MSRRTSHAIEVARPSPTSDPEDILEAQAGGAPRSADPFADQALDLVGRALGLCSFFKRIPASLRVLSRT